MNITNFQTNDNLAEKKLYLFLALFTGLCIPVVLIMFNVQLDEKLSLCPHKMITGLPCAGCGFTKSVVCFYKADVFKSFSFHIFGPFLVILSVFLCFALLVELFTRKNNISSVFFNKKFALILALTWIVYHVIRMIYFISSHSFSDILKESIWR